MHQKNILYKYRIFFVERNKMTLTMTPKLRNILLISFLILVFLFFIVHSWMNRVEGFQRQCDGINCINCNHIERLDKEGKLGGSIQSLIPCTPKILEKNEWFQGYNDTNGDPSYFVRKDHGFPWLLSTDFKDQNGNPLDTKSMSIGFWIYNDSRYMRGNVFGMGNLMEDDRVKIGVPRIRVWGTAMSVSRTTNMEKDLQGADVYSTVALNNIPIRKPCYITVVFSPKAYKFYRNGKHIHTWENKEQQDEPLETNSEFGNARRLPSFITIGDNYYGTRCGFYLRDFEIFASQLQNGEVKLLYCTKRKQAMEDPTFNPMESGNLTRFLSSSSSSKEAFTSLSNVFATTSYLRTNVGPGLPIPVFSMRNAGLQKLSDAQGEDSELNRMVEEEEKMIKREQGEGEDEDDEGENDMDINDTEMVPANGITFRKSKLDKFLFLKLNSNKCLPYVQLKSDYKEYLSYTIPLKLENTMGFTIMAWYRGTSMKGADMSTFWRRYMKKSRGRSKFPRMSAKKYYEHNHKTYFFQMCTADPNVNIGIKIHRVNFALYVNNKKIGNTRVVLAGDQWHHGAFVFQKLSSGNTSVRYYHNGTYLISYETPDLDYNTYSTQFIGKSVSNDKYYDGDVGDFRIYSEPLDEDKVALAMNDLPRYCT